GEAERKLAHRVVHGASARPLPRRPTAVGKQGTAGASGGDGAVVHTRTLAEDQRTGWPAARRACLTAPMVSSPKWNTLAASTASAPASTAGGKCSTAPAPPEAISGISTTARTAAISSRSNPALVPSASIELSRISPAPSAAPRRAQSI